MAMKAPLHSMKHSRKSSQWLNRSSASIKRFMKITPKSLLSSHSKTARLSLERPDNPISPMLLGPIQLEMQVNQEEQVRFQHLLSQQTINLSA